MSIIGANDGCQVAYQCEAMSGAMHHIVDDFNYVEIVDDNWKPVAQGQPGRILITSLLKHSFPLSGISLAFRVCWRPAVERRF